MDDMNPSRAPDIFARADDLRKEWRETGTGPYAAIPATRAPDAPAAPGITPERRAAIHAKVLSTIGDFEPMIGPSFKPELTDQQLYDIAKRHMYDIGGCKAVNYLPFARELLASVAALVAENAALREQLEHRTEAANGAINAALMMPDPVREQLVVALRQLVAVDGGAWHAERHEGEKREALEKARAALLAAGAP